MKQIFNILAITLFSFTTVLAQNKVIDFDGVNDYVDLGSSVGGGVRTIDMWFKPSVAIDVQSANYSPLLVRDETPNANEFGLTFMPNSSGFGGQLLFYIYTGSNTSFRIYSNSNSWNAGQWYHVSAVVHPSQGMMLFIDGIKQNSTSSFLSPTIITSSSTLIGSWGLGVTRYFNGSIDDVHLSDSALYTSNFIPVCPDVGAIPSTIGVWNFNDSSNVTITTDSSSNMNNGIVYGATGVIEDVCTITTATNTIHFDGVDDYVDLGSTAATGTRTFEMWFKPSTTINSSLINYKSLLSRNTTSASNANGLYLAFIPNTVGGNSAGKLEFSISDNNGSVHLAYSDSNIWNASRWYHVAAVINPAQGMMLFIDGVKQNSTNNYIFPPVQNNSSITLGNWSSVPNSYFNGSIDDLRFSNTALYSSNFTPSCPDLIALSSTIGVWNFNDSSNVTITTDSSGNFNNGIIYGATGVKDTICQITTNINYINDNSRFVNVFPNPFSEKITFEFNNSNTPKLIRLYTIDGRLIIEKRASTVVTVDSKKLISGFYFFQVIENDKVVISQKLIKE